MVLNTDIHLYETSPDGALKGVPFWFGCVAR